MTVIDQNSMILSQEQHLSPKPCLLDSRTEKDLLCFLTDFASLINFYDTDNTQQGSWKPFLLKDPVFLLAHISKVSFLIFYMPYASAKTRLDAIFSAGGNDDDLSFHFNQIFNSINEVFYTIERWSFFMKRSDEQYEVKDYMLHRIRSDFSGFLWAINDLRDALSASSLMGKGIEPVNYFLYDTWDEELWKQSRNKNPYWEVLGLDKPLQENKKPGYEALIKACDCVFDFFKGLIAHAHDAYEELKERKSKYPDTTLLRTGVHLLNVHQQQLNGIAQKHLHFYYHHILKQQVQPAVADQVFICAELLKKDSTLLLPAGTLFNAGTDAQKNPIYFASSEAVCLNPAALSKACTLTALRDDAGFSSLYLQALDKPDALKQDENGQPLSWPTFGGAPAPPEMKAGQSLVLASPLLLLREGTRSIVLTMTLNAATDLRQLKNARYYLSTQSDWLPVTPAINIPALFTGSTVVMRIDLNPAQPPIEAFLKKPAGIDSVWPLLKIEFDSFSQPATPPLINTLTIDVTVSNIKTFNLYNDFGGLDLTGPFPLFGPSPLYNSSFIIGSGEIFSKPLSSFYLELEWDKLPSPPDLNTYYRQYNNYLSYHNIVVDAPAQQAASAPPDPPAAEKKKWYQRAWNGISKAITFPLRLFKKKKAEPAPSDPYLQTAAGPYTNNSFTVDFKLLNDHEWNSVDLSKRQQISVAGPGNLLSAPLYKADAACAQPVDSSPLLFSTAAAAGKCVLTNYSVFGSDRALFLTNTANAGIQTSPLKFSAGSAAGFLKMNLSGISSGFGSAFYPNIVSDIALHNSLLISAGKGKDVKDLAQPANPPFVPVAKKLTAHYSASSTHTFDVNTQAYPLQCYASSPFATYPVYDSQKPMQEYSYSVSPSATFTKTGGLPLFPSFYYEGLLFLQLTNLIAAAPLSLYFQLVQSYSGNTDGKETCCYYLSTGGWKELEIISDETAGFCCPGIITVFVPGDIDLQAAAMNNTGCWICIGAKNPAAFAQTVFLKTNGILVKRYGTTFLSDSQAPKLGSGLIAQTAGTVPQIAAIVQPFSSFGGKGAEIYHHMEQRVSSRLRTKNRLVSNDDVFRLIRMQYDDIFYSGTVRNPAGRGIMVYVVKAYDHWSEPGAFMPLVNDCRREEIQLFLQQRTSLFSSVRVTNFSLRYVTISLTVTPQPGFEGEGLKKNIRQALDVFLSPWIKSSRTQLTIDRGITRAQVLRCVRGVEGVAAVDKISFTTWDLEEQGRTVINLQKDQESLNASPGLLFVSGRNHEIFSTAA